MIENNLLLSLDIFAAELEGPQKSGSAVVGMIFHSVCWGHMVVYLSVYLFIQTLLLQLELLLACVCDVHGLDKTSTQL